MPVFVMVCGEVKMALVVGSRGEGQILGVSGHGDLTLSVVFKRRV